MTVRAIWNHTVVAESADTVVVEGNHYFPEDAVRCDLLTSTRKRSLCPWKGIARYYSLTLDGCTRLDAAWRYKHPTPFAKKVKDRVAFGPDVKVVSSGDAGGAPA